ncbi:GNAT family N-acetyltransferase [Roseateles violae]|uniref:GNAT family N-acetyltransferase n=1 Tax=Roseateles violae TaxID=3058042 RepID=A0ABT8DPC5_9BURK|nr:GNAT family N-acetyltransferase [Pelomonas sp. PFR6]MDN3918900.1 GNAT family N-acetyltransferase [Pelomonas sp. PFR6]
MEILRTERLRLRQFTPADADFMLALVNDPDWHRNINDPGVRDREQALAWMETRLFEPYQRLGHGFWAVERLSDGQLIGMCGLFKRDSLPEVDVGYALAAPFRGQGYAREAAGACLAYGREQLGLRRILAIIAPDNTPSARVLESIGMVAQGVQQLDAQTGPSMLYAWEASTD